VRKNNTNEYNIRKVETLLAKMLKFPHLLNLQFAEFPSQIQLLKTSAGLHRLRGTLG